MTQETINNIISQVEIGKNFQPILFLGTNLELLNQNIHSLAIDILKSKNIDTNQIFTLRDEGKTILVEEFRNLMSKSYIKPSWGLQIFIIENISNITISRANAGLKFLEEPGEGNIILATNQNKSNILDTVLSRFKIIEIKQSSINIKNQFYFDMIDDYLNHKNNNLLSYFYNYKDIEKVDKKREYIDFLQNFKLYILDNLEYSYILGDVIQAIDYIQKPGSIPRYEIDKLIVKLGR